MKKKFCCSIFLCLLIFPVFCDDWILAATKFSFTRKTSVSSSQDSAASLLPQLILERIAENTSRMTTDEELLDRKLNTLLTERQSLFLQLSKEVQTRDALVLTEDNPKKLKKLIAEEDLKIKELQDKIEKNLETCEKARNEVEVRTAAFENEKEEKTFSLIPFNPFAEKKEEQLVPIPSSEKVVLYNNDSTALFSVSETAAAEGCESRSFEKEVVAKKINGLICGSISIYGNYASVTASLYVYPGCKNMGTVTEVGNINDCLTIASNIASYMIPKILNSRPVELRVNVFSDEPVVPVVSVDGVVHSEYSRMIVDSGIHTLEFSAKGYKTKTVTYNFENDSMFTVEVPMEKEESGQISLYFRYPILSEIYADGQHAGSITSDVQSDVLNPLLKALVTVNGQAVIGQVVSDIDSSYYFYYIPENLADGKSDLIVKGLPSDVAAQIDRRRIWMYRSYTLLVVSLPFTLYTQGRYLSMVNGYNAGSYSDVDEINRWNTMQRISTGITVGCACFFAVALVRYLRSANRVLPVYAEPAVEKDILKGEDWYRVRLNQMIEQKMSAQNVLNESLPAAGIKDENESEEPAAESENELIK